MSDFLICFFAAALGGIMPSLIHNLINYFNKNNTIKVESNNTNPLK
jgi:hypothetical protein